MTPEATDPTPAAQRSRTSWMWGSSITKNFTSSAA